MTVVIGLLFSGLRFSVPLLFASYGGLLSERSGIANVALESYLLTSAFAAATTITLTGSLYLGVGAGMMAGVLTALIFGFVTIKTRADQIVAGMTLNLLVMGLLPIFNKLLFDMTGQTPNLPPDLRFDSPFLFFILAVFAAGLCQFILTKTAFGLRLLAAGENPTSLETQGVNVDFVRIKALALGGLLTSFGGIYLATCAGSGYIRNMSAGRGFIALAALIFGRWKPIPTFIACVFFGMMDSLSIFIEGVPLWPNGPPIPGQIVHALPYIMTLLALAGLVGRIRAPAAINKN